MNIDSIIQSLSPIRIRNTDNQEIQYNTLASKVVSIKNSSIYSDTASIKNLPYVAMKNISNHLSLEDIYNIRKINIYGDVIYQDSINDFQKELMKWADKKHDEHERRDIAVREIIKCVKERNPRLILNDLNLTSLPNIKALIFVDEIHLLGNEIKDAYLYESTKLKLVTFSFPSQWNNNNKCGFGHAVYINNNGNMCMDVVYRDYGDNDEKNKQHPHEACHIKHIRLEK